MFDRVIAIATAAGAILQAGVALVFFGTLTMVVLTSFSVIPMPY